MLDKRLSLELQDNGQGFDPAATRTDAAGSAAKGLNNLRARAAALDGRFTIESAIGSGTTVRLEFPLGRP